MADTSTNKALAKAELKKSLHQSVVSLCDEVDGKIFSEQFKTALSDSSLRLLEHMISKMNDFSSHAKRKKISVDDVLLYFRSRPIMRLAMNFDKILWKGGRYVARTDSIFEWIHPQLLPLTMALAEVNVLKESMTDTSSDEMDSGNNSVLSLGNDSD